MTAYDYNWTSSKSHREYTVKEGRIFIGWIALPETCPTMT